MPCCQRVVPPSTLWLCLQCNVLELRRLLNEFVTGAPFGVAMLSPSDVTIPPDNIVQPDVYVIPVRRNADQRMAEQRG